MAKKPKKSGGAPDAMPGFGRGGSAAAGSKPGRRAVVDQMRAKQKRADRRRNVAIVGASALIALLIVGAAAFQPLKEWWDLRQFDSMELAEIGAPASACQDVTTETATGNQQHVPPGTPIDYPDSPPAFGEHYDIWDGFERKYYSAGDRPDLGELVHNLEHGYTILWYDETIADDAEQMDAIRGIAEKFEGTDNLRAKFKAVPWTEEDGEPFPDGQRVALTHWAVSPAGADAQAQEGENAEQVGVWQYCEAPSGEALDDFMRTYPYTNSPEPNAG